MTGRRIALYLGAVAALISAAIGWYSWAFLLHRRSAASRFDGERAYADVIAQVGFGPRIPGSAGHARAVGWITDQVRTAGWNVDVQPEVVMGHELRNIRARRGEGPPRIILAAHYDTRLHADRDPDPAKRTQPVPGAEDGASGAAVLVELARTLPEDTVPVWLVFFDGEDNGGIAGWDWALGAQAFVAGLQARPEAMILLDMVGDEDLSLPMEGNSEPALRESVWKAAADLGHESIFSQRVRSPIEDDHLPFLRAGIPAVDIIDLDYAYWHTTQDIPDHVSPKSLQIVGDVISYWLVQQRP